jgi:signal transduction histidine kinase
MITESQATTSAGPLDSKSSSADARSHRGSLRSKLVLSLAAVFFLFLTIDEMVRQKVIQPEFAALEESGAIRDANRVLAALNAEVDHLTVLARHWGAELREREYSGRLDQSPLRQAADHLDWVATVSADGTWRWLVCSPEANATDSPDNGFVSLLNLCRDSGRISSSGMTRVGTQSLVLFSLLNIAPEGHVEGSQSEFLLIARKVDDDFCQSLRRQTQVEFTLQSPRTDATDQKLVVWQASESTLVVEVQLVGLDDKKLANVYIEVPRDIMASSQHTTLLARNSFIFGSVAALLILLVMLQSIVISPLSAIRRHSDHVAENGLNTPPLILKGNDEITELARAFDHMVQRLSHTQTQLAQTSQAAGRSQVASTVIHNVGNVLTNVNSLIDAACDRTQRLRISPLNKLADRLRSEDQNIAMLEATPDYLEGLAGSLLSDQQSISELLSTLNDNVRHIHDVIRAQRQHADQSLELRPVALHDVIQEAISCCRARLEEDSVQVTVSGQLQVEIACDRSLMLQTMINLIGNARYAMRSLDSTSRHLQIRASADSRTAQIEFQDNGCGMTPETLARVFDAHFTTREGGTGLGLHFCAITLKRIGGTIEAASEGHGKGSVFTIRAPRPLRNLERSRRTVTTGNSS